MRLLAVSVGILAGWFLLEPAPQPSCAPPLEFARELRAIIVRGDEAAFRQLPCYPVDCIGNDDLRFVFGTKNEESFIRRFLTSPNVKVRIFGPYTYSDQLPNASYAIMYYDPAVVKFDSEGMLSQQDREELWWKGYIETVVSPVGSRWGFHRTPFYHGVDPPWAEDF